MIRVTEDRLSRAASAVLRSRSGAARLPVGSVRVHSDRLGWLLHLRDRDCERVAEVWLDDVRRPLVAVRAAEGDADAEALAAALQKRLWDPGAAV